MYNFYNIFYNILNFIYKKMIVLKKHLKKSILLYYMSQVAEIIYKKLVFFKNISSQGGAMLKCIESSNDTDKIIHIHNKNLGRLWGKIQEDHILKLIKKNIGLYEVLHNFPYKVYFDIDGNNDCNLQEIKDIINKYFVNCKMSISGYEIEDKKSYHIILNNYTINNEEERDKLKFIVKYLKSLNSHFDDKVYTKNRNMKAINQSKINKPVQKIIEDDNIKNHLITCFINENTNNINNILIDKVEEEEVKKLTTKNYLEWSNIEKMDLKLPEEFDFKDNLSLLNITPLNKNNDHSYTWRVARYSYYNNLTFDDFIGWYKNKNTDEKNLKKWASHWNLLCNHPQVTKQQYIQFLSNFYPELLDDKINDFTQLFNYDKTNIKYIESLTQNEFIFENKCKIFNIGMGGGKTTQTINFLSNSKDNFIWITPNISLAKNTYTRIKENSIYCNIYDSARNTKEKKELIENSENIIICLNSLFYTNKNYDTVVIDEIETFLKLFNNNSTLKELDTVFKKFVEILKNCKKIILLDAFLSNITLNFLDNLNISYEIIRRNNETSDRKAIIKKNFNNWVHDIIKDLNKNKKLIIFYPFKNPRKLQKLPSMSDLVKTIQEKTNKKGIFHNADSSDKQNKKLKDVNKHWVNYDFVVSNNKINVGLNFDIDYFDTCYLSIAGFNSPRDIIQFSYRARSLKSNTIKYCFLDHFNNTRCVEIEKVNNYNDIFKKLNEDIIKEKMANLKTTFQYFLNMAKYNISNETIYEELEPIKFIENDYYDYNKIDDYDIQVIKELEKNIYAQKANTKTKLEVKKYYYKTLFKNDVNESILADLWNDNKFNLINNIKKILYKDNVIKLLKNNYKWTCYYPDNIDKKFKFNDDDLKIIFDNYKFRSLTTKSKDHLILKSYINNIYGYQAVKSKKDESRNYKFFIDDKFKDYYLKISNGLKEVHQEDTIFIN